MTVAAILTLGSLRHLEATPGASAAGAPAGSRRGLPALSLALGAGAMLFGIDGESLPLAATLVLVGAVLAVRALPRLVPPGTLRARAGLPAAGRLISPGWHEVGRFLGPSIRGFWAQYEIGQLFRAAGLQDVGERRLSLGGGIVVWGRT